jgi:Flp pilus assembly protein TadD
VLNLLALCHRHTGKAAEAEALFREALDKAPDNADLLLNLAVTCFERGVEQARPLLARVVSAQPRNGKAWHNLAVMALATGRYEEAAGAWRKAVLADPNDETARANLDMLERRLP